MRESNYNFPPQNRAVVQITHLLYDRRALDTNSALALLNNLTSLTYLTSTSPRIREILTLDGGLERLLDILRESTLPRETTTAPDLWGLNGPPTARVINVDRQISLRHSLAFQCVVNIGVRGSEAIRTRVVQAGALDLVAQILESWLKQKGVHIFAGPLGSQVAFEALAAGRPLPGYDRSRRPRSGSTRATVVAHAQGTIGPAASAELEAAPTVRASGIAGFVSALTGHRPARQTQSNPPPRQTDTDVEMADAEVDTDGASIGAADESMDLDEQPAAEAPGSSTTPRAAQSLLPMSIPSRPVSRDTQSQASSAANSFSGDDVSVIPRAASANSFASDSSRTAGPSRPAPLNLGVSRIPQLAADTISNQSSPMGTPTRNENVEGLRQAGRRGTIVGRPINVNLAVRNERRREQTGSGTSDGGEELDLPTATINAGIAQANAQAMGGGTIVPNDPAPGTVPPVEIVEDITGPEEPDADAIAAEQARLDLEAGAPPGQPGAAQTPRVPPVEAAAPQQTLLNRAPDAQIIIANGAPRGFQDLGSYVGISSLLNPEGDKYSDDSILLALQLLAYLSKYPHVRSAFHHPRRPMHPTFNLTIDYVNNPLPERPPSSQTPNIFSLVERFTFRPSPSDPMMFRIPPEIQYWAGVIMRNACRKDEAAGGIRQCANMSCGRWESFPREFAKCRRCRKAKYCSKDCQSKAWSEGHRFWCNVRNEADPTAGPAPPSGPMPPSNGSGAAGDDDDGDFASQAARALVALTRRADAARTQYAAGGEETRQTARANTADHPAARAGLLPLDVENELMARIRPATLEPLAARMGFGAAQPARPGTPAPQSAPRERRYEYVEVEEMEGRETVTRMRARPTASVHRGATTPRATATPFSQLEAAQAAELMRLAAARQANTRT